MKYFSILLISGILTCINPIHAQNTLTNAMRNAVLPNEDVGSFKNMDKAFTLSLNTDDSSVDGTYIWKSPGKFPTKFGIDLDGKAVDGVLNLFKAFENEGNAREFKGTVFMTFPIRKANQEMNIPPKQRMQIELGIRHGRYDFLAKGMPIDTADTDGTDTIMAEMMPALTNEINTEVHALPSMFVYYNRNIQTNLLAGISVGWLRMNNYANLESRQVVESEPTAAAGTALVSSRQTARIGDYEDFDAMQVTTDVLFMPKVNQRPLAFNLFFRYTHRVGREDLFEPGFGIFSMKEGTPATAATPLTDRTENETEPSMDPKALAEFQRILERRNLPWQIVYGIVGQWDADSEKFRFGVVAGYNF